MTDTLTLDRAIMAEEGRPPEWVQLLPIGEFKGKDGRGPYRVADRKAAEQIIAASYRLHGEADIVIDYDHQSDFAAKPGVGGVAPAAGWITELEARDDGIWGKVEWTETAQAALRERRYRYISPVFGHAREGGTVQVLVRAGLTNTPNLNLKAVASADMSQTTHLAELRQVFGLADAAGPDAIVEAARALQAKAVNAFDPAKHVPIEVLESVTAELNATAAKGLSADAAEIAVNSAVERGAMPPALREWAISLCQQDRAAFDGFIDRTAGIFAHMNQQRVPGRASSDRSQPAEGLVAEVAQQLGLSAEDLKA